VDAEERSPPPLALVAAKPLAVTAGMPSPAPRTGGSALGSGQGAGESENLVLQRLEEMQRQILRMALQGPGNEQKSPLVLYYESARFFGNASSVNLVYGTLDGFTKDEEGAPNTVGFCVDFDCIGMRARGESQKKRATRWTGGGERVDLVVRHQDCAEAKGVSEVLMLGGVELKASKSRRTTPEQATVFQYWMKAKAELTIIMESKLIVYDPEHEQYVRFQYLATVAKGRMAFLEATTTFMVQKMMHHKWATIWR
jgi:hypothetical protein